jgi:site-specific DNA recombinase
MIDRKKATEAIILSRVSSKEQEAGDSTDAQNYRSNEYCSRKVLAIVKVFEFTESSTVGNRKKFMAAIEFTKNFARQHRRPIAVVTDKVDRLPRSFKESAMLYDLIEREKIELHFHVENCIIHRYFTSSEKLLWNLNVTMAQSYVDNIRDNVIHRHLHIVAGKGQGNIIVDAQRAPLVRKLFEEYATGNYTVAEILEHTKQWGLTNSRGNKGYLCLSHIHSILTKSFLLRYIIIIF